MDAESASDSLVGLIEDTKLPLKLRSDALVGLIISEGGLQSLPLSYLQSKVFSDVTKKALDELRRIKQSLSPRKYHFKKVYSMLYHNVRKGRIKSKDGLSLLGMKLY